MPTISRPRRFPFDYRKVLFAVLFSSSRPSQGIQNRYRCLYECSGELFMAYKNPINAFVRTMSRDLCVFSRSSEDVVGSGKVSLKTWEVNVEILLFSTPLVQKRSTNVIMGIDRKQPCTQSRPSFACILRELRVPLLSFRENPFIDQLAESSKREYDFIIHRIVITITY